jgi:flagellar motor switch protein FliM
VVEAAGINPGVSRYDFRETAWLPVADLEKLRRLNERFSTDLAETLAALARRQITVQSTSLEQVKASSIDTESPDVSLRFLLEIEPFGAQALLTMNSALLFAFLEALLGAKTSQTENPARELTEVEQSVLRDIDRVIVQELERAWGDAAGSPCTIRSQKSNLDPANLTSSRDGVIVASTVFSSDGGLGKIGLIYPARIVQGLGAPSAAVARSSGPSRGAQQAIFDRIRPAKLLLEGCLQDSSVSLADLLELRPGDLLRLDLPLTLPLDIHLNGQRRFQAELFQNDLKKSMRIQSLVPKKPESH